MFESYGFEIMEERAGGAGARSFLARVAGTDEQALITLAHACAPARADERLAKAVTRLAELNLAALVPARTTGRLSDGRLFVVSRFLDGETLAAVLERKGALTPDELVLLAIPLCGALSALRGQGLRVHALHPEQVLLVGGLGHCAPALLACPLFAASVEEGVAVDGRADIVAVGKLLRRALEDRRNRGPEGLKATVSVEPADTALREVIARCLSTDEAVAYNDPSEVARALADRQPETFIRRSLDSEGPAQDATPPTKDEVREGEVLGSYVLERLLGEGAMGRVFLARHLTLGRQVAVKVLRSEHGATPALQQRFFQEAKAVNQIDHEHIVEIHDFVEERLQDGRPRAYCVLELLGGQSLAQALAEHPFEVKRSLTITQQICRALAAAHRVGVVHRDIKPDNLQLIERGGTADFVKVLDFGVAKLDALSGTRASATAAGTIVGTPTYMAPEQAAGLPTDARTDVYAVGTVLYEMLAGHPPFSGANFGQLAVQVISHSPPPLPRFTRAGEKIPWGLRALVLRCLEKDPSQRPASMAELEERLSPFLQPAPRVRRLALRRLVPLAAGVALLAGTGVHRFEAKGSKALAHRTATRARVMPAVRWGSAVDAPEPSLREITVKSRPSGARVVRVDTGEALGVTPLAVRVGADQPLRIRLTLPGRRPAVRTVLAGTRTFEVGLARAAAETRRHGHVDPFEL